MGGTYTIHCYFNAEEVRAVLNAIVMLMGSGGGVDGDYLSLLRICAVLGLFIATAYGFLRARGEEAAHYLVMMAIFYATLFTPRVSVTVEDHGLAAGSPTVVDNVPLGLAFFASTTSHIGYWLTERTETFFSLPDSSMKLGTSGLMGSSRALRESQSAAFPDPVMAQDMINFMRDCINPELVNAPGAVSALMKSTNIWKSFSKTELDLVNPGRMATLIGIPDAISCEDVYETLGARLGPAATAEQSRIATLLYPAGSAATANAVLASMLPAAESLIMTASASMADAIKQRMVINVLNDTSSSMAQIMNDPTAAQVALGHAIAASSANSAYLVMARLASETLPIIHNAIELVIIGVFPIILVLIIIAGTRGGAVLRSYVMAMLWVQLWAPLYAIVNFVGTMAAAKSMKGALAGIDGIAIANAAQLLNTTISGEAVAGMLTISVPIIALALVKGGEMAMSSVAGNLTAPANSAAQSAGQQVGQGNVSMGNLSWGNYSANNAGANKSDTALKSVAGNWGQVENGFGDTGFTGDKSMPKISTPRMGNLGIGGQIGGKMEAATSDSSGVGSSLERSHDASVRSSTGGGFTKADRYQAEAAIGRALETMRGGGRDYGAAQSNSGVRSADTGTNLATANQQAEKSGTRSHLGLDAGAGSNAAKRQEVRVTESIPLSGQRGSGVGPVVPGAVQVGSPEALAQPQSGIPAQAGTTNPSSSVVSAAGGSGPRATGIASSILSDGIVSTVLRQFGLSGGIGYATSTDVGKTSTSQRTYAAGEREQIQNDFRNVLGAVDKVLGKDSSSGTRAAASSILGEVSERLDAATGSNTRSIYQEFAQTQHSRTSARSASTAMNQAPLEQSVANQIAAERGISDINRARLTDPTFGQEVVRRVEAVLAGALAAGGEGSKGMDGTALGNVRPVGEVQSAAEKAVWADGEAAHQRARESGEADRAKARSAARAGGAPGAEAMPDLAPAEAILTDVKGRVREAGGRIQGNMEATRRSGALAEVAHARATEGASTARTLLSNTFGGGVSDYSVTSTDLAVRFKAMYDQGIPEVRQIYDRMASTDRVDIKDADRMLDLMNDHKDSWKGIDGDSRQLKGR